VRWTVGLSSAAIKNLDHLPPRAVPAVVEFIFGALADNPHIVGKPLRTDFAGTYSARDVAPTAFFTRLMKTTTM
jgi:mRNA interferase RelE/StbE